MPIPATIRADFYSQWVIPAAGGSRGVTTTRGLGSVVVGGLSLSAILTLLLIPPMLSLTPFKSRTEPQDTRIAAQPAE